MTFATRLEVSLAYARTTLEALARAANIDESELAIAYQESETPEQDIIDALASVLHVDPLFLERRDEPPVLVPVSPTPFLLNERDRVQLAAKATMWFERYFDMEAMFDVENIQVAQLIGSFNLETVGDVLGLAATVREMWGMPQTGPIRSLAELFEVNGVRVGLFSGMENFDACAFLPLETPVLPVIVVNRDIPGENQRVAMARELFYLTSGDEGPKVEAADIFADAFLLPPDDLANHFGDEEPSRINSKELARLKLQYGVPVIHMVNYLSDLGIVRKEWADQITTRLVEKGYLEEEPGPHFESEVPIRMVGLGLLLVANGTLHPEQAAAMCQVPFDRWQEISADMQASVDADGTENMRRITAMSQEESQANISDLLEAAYDTSGIWERPPKNDGNDD